MKNVNIIILLLLPFQLFAQSNKIIGHVVDDITQEPIEANVVIYGTSSGVKTNEAGEFSFSDIDSSRIVLKISGINRITITDTIFFNNSINEVYRNYSLKKDGYFYQYKIDLATYDYRKKIEKLFINNYIEIEIDTLSLINNYDSLTISFKNRSDLQINLSKNTLCFRGFNLLVFNSQNKNVNRNKYIGTNCIKPMFCFDMEIKESDIIEILPNSTKYIKIENCLGYDFSDLPKDKYNFRLEYFIPNTDKVYVYEQEEYFNPEDKYKNEIKILKKLYRHKIFSKNYSYSN